MGQARRSRKVGKAAVLSVFFFLIATVICNASLTWSGARTSSKSVLQITIILKLFVAIKFRQTMCFQGIIAMISYVSMYRPAVIKCDICKNLNDFHLLNVCSYFASIVPLVGLRIHSALMHYKVLLYLDR